MFLLTVENLSYRRETWTNNVRRVAHKRHTVGTTWIHGETSKVVDGNSSRALQSCMVLDNSLVERPMLRIDLGRKSRVSGVVIVTWQGQGQGKMVVEILPGNVTIRVVRGSPGIDRFKAYWKELLDENMVNIRVVRYSAWKFRTKLKREALTGDRRPIYQREDSVIY